MRNILNFINQSKNAYLSQAYLFEFICNYFYQSQEKIYILLFENDNNYRCLCL